MKEMQKLLSRMRAAVDRYHMIEDGDRIAVGISGGKDSLSLLCAMVELQCFYPVKYTLVAVLIDMGFDISPSIAAPVNDYSAIRELCDRLGVELIVKKTEIAKVIFDVRHESNPCSLCARMRRGSLHDAALEAGCNKLALGHHFDDAAETFMLNLFFEGRVGCFSPVSYMSHKKLYVIRPFVLAAEKDIKSFVRKAELPVIKSPCPSDKASERAYMKDYLREFDVRHRGLYRRIVGAMERGEIDGWKE